jgi:hypothetical protein
MAKQIRYYYNGELMRTSAHTYTHAVLDEKGKCIACRNGLDNAIKAKEAEKQWDKRIIRDSQTAIKALQAGRTYYIYKIGGAACKYRFEDGDTVTKYQEQIERSMAHIAVIDGYQVVELEAK